MIAARWTKMEKTLGRGMRMYLTRDYGIGLRRGAARSRTLFLITLCYAIISRQRFIIRPSRVVAKAASLSPADRGSRVFASPLRNRWMHVRNHYNEARTFAVRRLDFCRRWTIERQREWQASGKRRRRSCTKGRMKTTPKLVETGNICSDRAAAWMCRPYISEDDTHELFRRAG